MASYEPAPGASSGGSSDDADEIFLGPIASIIDRVSFHADTVKDLKAALRWAVNDYMQTCAAIGKQPQKSYSGQLMLRVSPEVHAAVARAAKLSGESLNAWARKP